MRKGKNSLDSKYGSNQNKRATKNDQDISIYNILNNTENNELVFYNPNMVDLQKCIFSFCEEINKHYDTPNKLVVVSGEPALFDLGIYEEKLNHGNSNKTILIKTDLQKLPEIYEMIIDEINEFPTSIIFDNINELEDLEIIIKNSHTFKNNFKHVVLTTSSPSIFLNVRDKGKNFSPIFYESRKYFDYFKRYKDKIRLIEYKNMSDELYLDSSRNNNAINSKFFTLSQFINDLRMGSISSDMFDGDISVLKSLGDRILFLLLNGVYDSKFVVDIVMKNSKFEFIRKHLEHLEYKSNKLSKLFNLINEESGRELTLVVKKPILIRIICSVLDIHFPNCKMTNLEGDGMRISLKKYERTLDLTILGFNEYLSKSNWISSHVLFFDFIQMEISDRVRVFVCSKDMEFLINQVIKEEELAKTDLVKNENMNVSENTPDSICTTNIDTVKNFDFVKNNDPAKDNDVIIRFVNNSELTSDEVKEISEELNFIVKDVKFTPPTLRLENNRNLSYFGVRLANHLPYAVEVANLKGSIDGFSTVCESIAFGTLTKHNAFIDSYVIDKNTYLFPKKDVILLYCISNHELIKIEIPTDCMEKYIIMDKYGLIIDVYICIGRRPKFYNVDISNTKIDRLKNIIRTKERYEFLEHLQWNRASLNEVPFIENRNDIKIRVNLKFNPDQKKLKSYLKYHKNPEEESKFRKVEIYDIVDMFVSVFTGYPGVKILFSKFLREKPTALSTVQILDQLKNTDFSDYYFVVCLLSQKGRFFNYNLDLEDCVRIKSNVKGMITTLLNRVNTRFMNIKKILENHRDMNNHVFNDSHLMRHVIITPLSIIYKLPISFDGNRVLREFDHEKFLRVSLREEDMLSKVKDTSMRNQNNVFDYLRKILFDGIFIGERKYFFLGMTMSQMRLHSTWFVTPYFHKSQLIGPDYIRNWLGDFSEIKNIGKYAIRLGQALSSTNATINIDKYTEVCDIERNGHTFSDGIGLISFSAAKEVSKMLRIDHIPSAFQIRFAGFKGVVCVHPILEQDKAFLKDLNFNDCKKRLMKNLKVNFTDNKKEEDFKRVKMDDLSCNLLTRPSMKKFESTHRNIEVVTYASCQPCYLNRQYIMLLEGLGVDISVFLEFHDNYLFSHLADIYNRPYDYVKRHFGLFSAKFNLQNSKIYKKMITTIFNKHMRDFYKKNKILVKKGCVLMGGLDELGVLKENEVYLRVRKDLVAHNEGFIFEDEYAVVTGPVLIMKNPCLHPGDIRTVNAVNRPELRYMKDVLVFNQKGERPLPNMCSGSDLDGDMYTIIWDSSLLPKKSYAPSEYTGLIVLNKEIVSSSDIVNFYIRYIRNYHLGSIANAHLVQCDENSIDHENSIFLAELFNRSIDFPKTGFMATVPETLMPQRYPDFMESKFNSYPSLKTVGVLFRRGFDSQIVNKIRCECRKCLGVYVEQFPPVFRSIIENSNIKYKEILKNPIISEKSVDLFNNYKKDITGLMDKHGYKKEELAFLNFAEEEGTSEEILIDIKNLFHKYRNIINDTKANLSELLKLSEDCYENINSLPLVFHSSFICKGKIHLKNLNSYKNLDYRFILNSSLVIKYFEGESNEVKSYNKNDVYVERELYENLLKTVNESNQRILKDVFELLFIGKFFDTKSFDLVCLFFKYLMGKFQNEEIDRLKVCKMMLEISRKFFTKAATLPFCHFVNREILSDYKNGERKLIYRASLQTKNNFHIRQKYVDNNEKVKIIIDNLSRIISTTATLLILKINTIEKGFHIYFSGKSFQPLKAIEPKLGRKKVESFSHFIIKGMFDNSDELKLESYNGARKKGHENTPLYVPKLLNKGFCDSDTYKDNFKQFFIDIFLGGLPNLNPKDYHLGILLQIMVTPGRFYFYNVNPLSINTILTVDKLKSKTLFYKGELLDKNALKSYFYNYHLNIFDNDLRQNYISSKGIVFDEKSYEYIFSFVKENVRYQAYYEKEGDKFILIRITKNKKLKGKAFLLEDDTTNLSNDVQFELSYEEIILEGDKNVFDEEEKVFLSGDLLTVKNNNFVVNDLLYGSKQFRFEINTMLNVRNSKTNETYPFTISSREVHTPSKHGLILDSKNTRLAVYSLISKIYKVRKDLNQFIGDFDMVWNCYKAYYG